MWFQFCKSWVRSQSPATAIYPKLHKKSIKSGWFGELRLTFFEKCVVIPLLFEIDINFKVFSSRLALSSLFNWYLWLCDCWPENRGLWRCPKHYIFSMYKKKREQMFSRFWHSLLKSKSFGKVEMDSHQNPIYQLQAIIKMGAERQVVDSQVLIVRSNGFCCLEASLNTKSKQIHLPMEDFSLVG